MADQPKNQEQSDVNDPIGKAIVRNRLNVWGGPFRMPYTNNTARFFGGYGAGIAGKLLSEGDSNAEPLEITQTEIDSWNALEKFAYKHHAIFFSTGTILFSSLIGVVYYVSNINPFFGIAIFFISVYPLFYFIRILFLIEGQSLPTKDLFPTGVTYRYRDIPDAEN